MSDNGYAGCVIMEGGTLDEGFVLIVRAEDSGPNRIDVWVRQIGVPNAPVLLWPNQSRAYIEEQMIKDGTVCPYVFPCGKWTDMTLTIPPAWWFRVQEVVSRAVFGPTVVHPAIGSLLVMTQAVKDGYILAAYDNLRVAEAAVKIASVPI